MKRWAALTFVGLLNALTANASQDGIIGWQDIQLSGDFSIPPLPSLCPTAEECEFPAYEGTVSIRAATSVEDGRLTLFEIRIDGEPISLDLVTLFGASPDFELGRLQVKHSLNYIPESMREGIVGAIGPYLSVREMFVADNSCPRGSRIVSVTYVLDVRQTEVRSPCYQP